MGRFDCCTVWRNHYEFAKRLGTAAERAAFMMWVIEYQLDGVMPEDNNSVAFLAFKMIVPSLDFAMKQRANGGKGGRPANPSRTQAETQTVTQTKPKQNPDRNPDENQPTTQTVSQTEASRARVSETEKRKQEIGNINPDTDGIGGCGGGKRPATSLTGGEHPSGKSGSGDKSHSSSDSADGPPYDWKQDKGDLVQIRGTHTFYEQHHSAVDLALTITGERTEYAKRTYTKLHRETGDKAFRTCLEVFFADMQAGELPDNPGAALVARIKKWRG